MKTDELLNLIADSVAFTANGYFKGQIEADDQMAFFVSMLADLIKERQHNFSIPHFRTECCV